MTAKRAGAALRTLPSSPWAPAVYTSPYYRCLQTADEIAAELGLNVRIEPGLSEICIERVFDAQPQLRVPDEALASALQRTEVDLTVAPAVANPPTWPEKARASNQRVLQASQSLVARHPGMAVCLVCHCHSLVEITRHLPKFGGGAVASQAGYCAMSHIDASGRLICALDQSYLRHGDLNSGRAEPSAFEVEPAGFWRADWCWQAAAEDYSFVESLLDMDLEQVLSTYPRFNKLFLRGTVENQDAWRCGWKSRCRDLRLRLMQAQAKGLFQARAGY